jgi:hypothetical protein
MGIKIEPIEQEKKFKPFKITLDIENMTQANLIYAVLNCECDGEIIGSTTAAFIQKHGSVYLGVIKASESFPAINYIRYKEHVENIMIAKRH